MSLQKSKRINKNQLQNIFAKNGFDATVIHFDVTDSTNIQARLIAKNGFDRPVLILADSQTSGRGRLGKSFYSPIGTGLYLTYMYKPNGSLESNVSVTLAAAVAVLRAIEKMTELKPVVKWVNDIYLSNRKVCGILAESFYGAIAVGIGVNLSTVDFPEELKQKAGSLNVDIDENVFCAELILQLNTLIKELDTKGFIDEYRAHSMVLGKKVSFIKDGFKIFGTAITIDDDGGLEVRHDNGEQTVLKFGEISLEEFEK